MPVEGYLPSVTSVKASLSQSRQNLILKLEKHQWLLLLQAAFDLVRIGSCSHIKGPLPSHKLLLFIRLEVLTFRSKKKVLWGIIHPWPKLHLENRQRCWKTACKLPSCSSSTDNVISVKEVPRRRCTAEMSKPKGDHNERIQMKGRDFHGILMSLRGTAVW